MAKRVMVVQTNSDGRPCGWGIAAAVEDARAEAQRQWDTHRCYPGERKGQVVVKQMRDEA